jgi:hypothetical protein
MSRSQNHKNFNRLELNLPVAGGAGPRKAVLRLLEGAEIAPLLDLDFSQPRETVISHALARHTESLEGISSPAVDALHQLTLADRHALVRALLIAEGKQDIEVVARCACGELSELHLDLRDVPLAEAVPAVVQLSGDGRSCNLRFPTAADLDVAHDELDLLRRCLELPGEELERWLPLASEALDAADPLGTIQLIAECAACKNRIEAACDVAQHWLAHLHRRIQELLEEVHVLARSYHWSEQDILDLPQSRRRVYLEMCHVPSVEELEAYA